MSDEEEFCSDEFSASEDDWEPTNYKKDDYTSDEDSDFELPNKVSVSNKKSTNVGNKASAVTKSRKRKGLNSLSSPKISSKKRKPAGQSLRMKLFKRYNPPPKTSPAISRSGSQATSPIPSTSKKQCNDNLEKPKEEQQRKMFSYESSDGATSASASDASDNEFNKELSDPSYFELRTTDNTKPASSLQQLEPQPMYDFKQFFENFQHQQQMQKTCDDINSEKSVKDATVIGNSPNKTIDNLNDINALLALGENLNGDLDSNADINTLNKKSQKRTATETVKNSKKSKTTNSKSNKLKKKTVQNEDESHQSEDSDWEEVKGTDKAEDVKEPSENVPIYIEFLSKKDEREFNKKDYMDQELKRQFNSDVRNHQVLLHKASLLCRFVRCYRYNRLLNNTTIMQTVLKILPSKNAYPTSDGTCIKYFKALLTWFKDALSVDCNDFYIKNRKVDLKQFPRDLAEQIIARKAACRQDYVFIFVALIRAMGLHCRLMVNMQPIPLKPDKSRLLPITVKPDDAEDDTSSITDLADLENSTKTKETKKSKTKSSTNSTDKKSKKETNAKVVTQKKKQDSAKTEVASSRDQKSRKTFTSDMWAEVWCDVEDQWAYVDIFNAKVGSVEEILKSSSVHAIYVFAFQNNLTYKEVTDRYCSTWTSNVRSWRVDKDWLEQSFSRYKGERTARDCKEDLELRLLQERMPLPTTINDCKNHPLYALRRHLLKFEAIYPPDAPSLGFVKGEAIYSRACVYTLHSRDIWLKQARVVKMGERPYKIVKARPKWDRLSDTVIKDQPLEIFGFWQTKDYEPPAAENGVVPRNAYGNVDLFKPEMIPKNTVHIRLAGLNRICRKLGIDCANAVIGFDFHQGASHPTFDGFIVCEEFADTVIEAWHQEQEAQERKEEEKYLAKVYGNWKKLIRGVLIREKLKLKYNF